MHYVVKLRLMGTPPCFSAIFTKGNNFCDFLFAFRDEKSPSEIGSTHKGKNLMGADSLTSVERGGKMKMEELPPHLTPLKVYPNTLPTQE